MSKEAETESLEESIFKTLNHQTRRDILRVIGEMKEATFTEIKTAVKAEDSPSLSYHLNALNGLIIQKEGRYKLSELGEDTYALICKVNTTSESTSILSSFRKTVPIVIIANAILWAAALLITGQLEGRLSHNTIFTFSALWLVSNGILYSLLTKLKGQNKCRG